MKEEEFQALVLNQFSKMDEKFSKIDEKFDKIDEKFNKIDEKLDTIEASQLRMENKFDEKIGDATRQKLY